MGKTVTVKTVQDFGRKVEGEISHYGSTAYEQHDPQLLLDSLDALFEAFPDVKVKWRQYTPYFNDGDACEFSVHGASFRFGGTPTEDEEDSSDYGDGFWDNYTLKYATDQQVLPESADKDLFLRLWDSLLIGNIHHKTFLQASFGDPAEVIATKDGFEVEFYEHD